MGSWTEKRDHGSAQPSESVKVGGFRATFAEHDAKALPGSAGEIDSIGRVLRAGEYILTG